MGKSPRADPYVQAREEIARRCPALVPIEVTLLEVDVIVKPPCYTSSVQIPDPVDVCGGCRLLLPCLTFALIRHRDDYFRLTRQIDPSLYQHVASGW